MTTTIKFNGKIDKEAFDMCFECPFCKNEPYLDEYEMECEKSSCRITGKDIGDGFEGDGIPWTYKRSDCPLISIEENP